ncbi:hypothetical protein NKG05_19045 [Oerskovia sp. M15]
MASRAQAPRPRLEPDRVGRRREGAAGRSVRVLPEARIALDVQGLLQARVPGTRVTDVTFKDGMVVLDGVA